MRATYFSAVWQHFTWMMFYLLDISVEDKSRATTEAFIGEV
jgi:hypothetical protein